MIIFNDILLSIDKTSEEKLVQFTEFTRNPFRVRVSTFPIVIGLGLATQ